MSRPLFWGAVLWLLRPAYVVVELLVAARTTGAYHVAQDSVSELGATGCSPASCSPWSEWINGAFVVVGLMLVVGTTLLAARLGPVVTVLLWVAGLSSVATGLTPVDEHPTLHAVAAAPLFACQPVALLVLARRLRRTHVSLARGLLVIAAVSAGAAVGFVSGATGEGAFERLALWPPLVALAAVAAVIARAAVRSGRSTGAEAVDRR